jgi:ABC-type glycerol-3-phosphate transport system permease component
MAASSTTITGTPTAARRESRPPAWLVGRVAIYLCLTIGAIGAAFPFFWMLMTSLKTQNEATRSALTIFPAAPQWHNYVAAWQTAPFGRYFFNTTVIAVAVVAGMLVTSVLAAYAFARLDFSGKNVVFALFLATMMIPFEATLIPNYITITRLPDPGSIRFIADFPFLAAAANWYNTYWALIVPWTANVVNIFLLRQFFISMPQELYDAAALDGCSHLRTLWSIMLPLARAPLAATIIFSFLSSWNSLLWPLLVTGKDQLRPIQLGLSYFVNAESNDPQLLMAASAFTIVPIVILYFVAQRQFIEGIASSGLKG